MKRRWLHIALVLLVLVQPAARAAALATMVAMQLDSATHHGSGTSAMKMPDTAALRPAMSGMAMSGMAMSGMAMPGCHETVPDVPSCCDAMNGVVCGMDCGAASPAVTQPPLLSCVTGHGMFVPALPCAAPSSPPTVLYKPPRTS